MIILQTSIDTSVPFIRAEEQAVQNIELQVENTNESIEIASTPPTTLTLTTTTDAPATEMQNSGGNNTHRASPMSALRFTRDIIGRRATEQTRNWRDNLNNVFMEIRPLVQQAQSVNNSTILSSLLPTNSRPVSLDSSRNNLESVIINFDGVNPQNDAGSRRSSYHNHSPLSSPIPPHHHSFLNQMPVQTSASTGQHLFGDIPSRDAAGGSTSTLTDDHHGHAVGVDVSDGGIGPAHHHHHHHHHHHNHNQQNNAAPNPDPNDGLVNETFAQLPQARTFLTTLNRYIPYIVILLAKYVYDEIDGILDLFALLITFSHANWVVRQEIAKQKQRGILPLLRELLYIVLVIAIIGFMLEKKSIFLSIIFTSSLTHPFTLKNLLFSVGITDLILKLITVGIKILITLLPPTLIEYKGRGRIYLMTESISQLYRALAPIHPWFIYLLDSYEGPEKIVGVLLTAVYIISKGSDLLDRAKFCKRSFIKLLQKVSFGVTPTKEQIQTAGVQCPICHDDYNGPVLLECNHIFCESCVGTWFDREQTCPLCRAKVVDDPSWRDGSTTFFFQLF